MNCLLLGGASSAGKSTVIYGIAKYLVAKGFSDISQSSPTTLYRGVPGALKDFLCVLEGLNVSGEQIKIFINSSSDSKKIIRDVEKFYKENGGQYHILISSVRDPVDARLRELLLASLHVNTNGNFVLEIPMGKITREGNNKNIAISWYQDKMLELIKHILKQPPYMLL